MSIVNHAWNKCSKTLPLLVAVFKIPRKSFTSVMVCTLLIAWERHFRFALSVRKNCTIYFWWTKTAVEKKKLCDSDKASGSANKHGVPIQLDNPSTDVVKNNMKSIEKIM